VTYIIVMIRINIHEAKANLSRYLGRVERGETIILCKRNEPIAEIRPLPRTSTTRRPVGLGKARFEVPRSFFAPLPDEILAGFEKA